MSYFDILSDEVSRGIEGGNDGIPMGFDRLNKYVGIRKSIYFLSVTLYKIPFSIKS